MAENETVDIRAYQPDRRQMILILAIALAAVAYLSGKLASFIVNNYCAGLDATDAIVASAIVRTVVSVTCFIALGGGRWLRFDGRAIRDTWSFAKPLIIINLVLGFFIGLGVLGGLLNETINLEDFVKIGCFVTVFCLVIGINEEAMFRGLVFGGLLAKLGGTKGGVLGAAIISSLVFGYMHVIFDLDFRSYYSIGMGLMKTLETGMFAFILCVPALKGQNLWGAITTHAFFDWIIMCGNSISSGGFAAIAYTSSNPTIAMAGMSLLGVLCLLYLPRTIRSFKELRGMNVPQYGPFMKDTAELKDITE